jgi:hypothetical protein
MYPVSRLVLVYMCIRNLKSFVFWEACIRGCISYLKICLYACKTRYATFELLNKTMFISCVDACLMNLKSMQPWNHNLVYANTKVDDHARKIFIVVEKGYSEVYTYIQTYIHTCVHGLFQIGGGSIHTYISYIHTYIHIYIYTCLHGILHRGGGSMHTYTYTYIRTYIQTYMLAWNTPQRWREHTYVHIYIHTYIHA